VKLEWDGNQSPRVCMAFVAIGSLLWLDMAYTLAVRFANEWGCVVYPFTFGDDAA
jgi:hypothetical protein